MLSNPQVENILNNAQTEVVEPETIRELLPDITEQEFNKLQALITIKTSNYAFENFYAFENVVHAVNGIVPNVNMIEGADPIWIWYACQLMDGLRPNMELSLEVIHYISKIYKDEGIYFLPPYALKSSEVDTSTEVQILSAARHSASEGPFPIEADSFINRQAIELMKMSLYVENLSKEPS